MCALCSNCNCICGLTLEPVTEDSIFFRKKVFFGINEMFHLLTNSFEYRLILNAPQVMYNKVENGATNRH